MKKFITIFLLANSFLYSNESPTKEEISNRMEEVKKKLEDPEISINSKIWLQGYFSGIIYTQYGDY